MATILIVDDEAHILELTRLYLEKEGFAVETAADGLTALQRAQAEPPSLVILDVMMPRLDGFQVLQELRANPATRDLPVLVLTAKELTPEERRRLAESAQRVILKEARSVTSLLDQVRTALAAYRDGPAPPARS